MDRSNFSGAISAHAASESDALESRVALSPAITNSEVVLFAGAGASVPLGLPTTRGFMEILAREVERRARDVAAYDALHSVAKHVLGDDADIEGMLDLLVRWEADPQVLMGEARGLGLPTVTPDEVQDLRECVLQVIVRTYSDVDAERARYLYGWLLFWLKGYCEGWCPLPIFTTNYDWTFERMVEKAGKAKLNRLIDGFVPKKTGTFWTPNVFHRLKGSRGWDFVLFKLHGSTSWYRQPSGDITKTTHAEKDPGQLTSALIYPTLSKSALVNSDPFFTAYQYLRSCLTLGARLCVAIGYSFRDPEINAAFRAGLACNSTLQVLILDPGPDKLRILSEFDVGPERVTFVEDDFRYYGINRNTRLREAIEARMTPKCIMNVPYTPSPATPGPIREPGSAALPWL